MSQERIRRKSQLMEVVASRRGKQWRVIKECLGLANYNELVQRLNQLPLLVGDPDEQLSRSQIHDLMAGRKIGLSELQYQALCNLCAGRDNLDLLVFRYDALERQASIPSMGSTHYSVRTQGMSLELELCRDASGAIIAGANVTLSDGHTVSARVSINPEV